MILSDWFAQIILLFDNQSFLQQMTEVMTLKHWNGLKVVDTKENGSIVEKTFPVETECKNIFVLQKFFFFFFWDYQTGSCCKTRAACKHHRLIKGTDLDK